MGEEKNLDLKLLENLQFTPVLGKTARWTKIFFSVSGTSR